MSESFFGLRKRPFAALPDADCLVPLEGICQAYDELIQAAAEGRGIGVLTAPAGLGKSLVCQRLARELSASFSVVLLPSGNFLTRRALLQAILFELGHSFVRMGDQELRLALSTTLRAIRPVRRGLALIVDEAHLLAARMLEELRTLLSDGEGGEPLVRLIVSGQLSLEETLSRPECDAFNQRIACQVMLPSLTREQSASYISRRLAWAGANISEVLTRESLTAICEAADGVPRCLHQLADHCLTIASNRSEKPITLRTVREALDHLKQLPLTWAEPTVGRGAINPLEAARAQAATLAKPSDSLSDATGRGSHISEKSNRELLAETFFETYPLQFAPNEPKSVEPIAEQNAWEFDCSDEVVSGWTNTVPARHLDVPTVEREPYTGVTDDEIAAFDTLQPVETGFESAFEFGAAEPVLVVEPESRPVLDQPNEDVTFPKRLDSTLSSKPQASADEVLPETTSPRPASITMDEEVVIDRYAALDSALNRLTRTMLSARVSTRQKATEPIASSNSKNSDPISIEAIDAVHQRFDVVMPEDDSADERPRVKSVINTAVAGMPSPAKQPAAVATAEPVATAPGARETTTDERRPYQLLFSELRRRRRRV
jgi:type II secretory pathway predicted ATPase ExeA